MKLEDSLYTQACVFSISRLTWGFQIRQKALPLPSLTPGPPNFRAEAFMGFKEEACHSWCREGEDGYLFLCLSQICMWNER